MPEQNLSRKFIPWMNEDWLAVIIAFILILLAATGLLGKNGLNIIF